MERCNREASRGWLRCCEPHPTTHAARRGSLWEPPHRSQGLGAQAKVGAGAGDVAERVTPREYVLPELLVGVVENVPGQVDVAERLSDGGAGTLDFNSGG